MVKKERELIMTKEEKQLIETVDDEGKVVNFELFDIVEFEEKEYALLLPAESKNNAGGDDDEVVLMRLTKDGEDYLFEAIEDDEEFDKVAEYIENLEDEIDDED
jgi:uncharacterized protein YrzB (UPF0473 family)